MYGVFSQSVKKWDFQAGLRGEYATREFSMSGAKYPYDYFSAFPSGVALYNLDPATQAKASYSRRIRRPGTQELNPFPVWFDANNVFFGNPDVAPEYTDSYDFGLTKSGAKGMIALSPYYRRTSNIIRPDINTTDTLDNREVTSISFRNLAKSSSWGTDLTGQYRGSSNFKGTDLVSFPFAGDVASGADNYSASKSELLFLANVYADLGTWWCVTPFVGAGVGAARVSITNFTDSGITNKQVGGGGVPAFVGGPPVSSFATAASGSEWNFAWALHAGLAYKITPNVRVAMDVFNLFDKKASDIDYFYESRLAGEAAQEDTHFHPVEPRRFRVTLTANF